MSLNRDVFRQRPILGNRILTPIREEDQRPYYPQDFNDSPVEHKEGSAKYASWTRFKKKYPHNAQLLVHLFGERDAIECHRYMSVISELKACTMCALFAKPVVKTSRLQAMGDS